jgi:hypothetical protein
MNAIQVVADHRLSQLSPNTVEYNYEMRQLLRTAAASKQLVYITVQEPHMTVKQLRAKQFEYIVLTVVGHMLSTARDPIRKARETASTPYVALSGEVSEITTDRVICELSAHMPVSVLENALAEGDLSTFGRFVFTKASKATLQTLVKHHRALFFRKYAKIWDTMKNQQNVKRMAAIVSMAVMFEMKVQRRLFRNLRLQL